MCGSCVNLEQAEWVARERTKMGDGSYSKPIWVQDGGFGDVIDAMLVEARYHFPHVSLNNPSMLAYTENPAKGEADRQTPIKVGRYLNRFTKGLTENRIREVVEAHNACFDTGELEVATTSKDIVQVYMNGPNSCMSHHTENFSSSEHPTVVYGSGDLGIAYIGGLAKPRARALVYLKKKVYSTIYGDIARLKSILDKSGYKEDTGADFEGAKVNKINCKRNPDFYVMPYLDNDYGVAYAKDKDGTSLNTHFVMSHSPDYCAQYTHGLHEECGWWCGWCEEMQNEGDDCVYTENAGDVCWSCYENDFFTCEDCDEVMHNDEWRTVNYFRTRQVTTDKLDPKTNTYIVRQERIRDERGVCSCCTDNYQYCESCDEVFEECTNSEEDDGYRCEDCHTEHEAEVEAGKHNQELEQEQDNNEE